MHNILENLEVFRLKLMIKMKILSYILLKIASFGFTRKTLEQQILLYESLKIAIISINMI